MKILFIKSTINSTTARADFGIGSLSAVLKKHHHQTGLFVVRNWDGIPYLKYRISLLKPDILAFSTYASSFQSTVRISNVLKKSFPRLMQVMGGIHLVLNPADIRHAPSIDAVCVGEGEYALLEFMNNYSKGNDEYLYTRGFWTRKKKRIITNPTVPFLKEIESLPFSDREIFISEGLSFGDFENNKRNYLDFLFTRGCPFACSYCSNHALRRAYGHDNYVRRMSPKRAIAWIRHDLARYACDYINILDDIFTLDRKWTEEFLSLYESIKMPFICHLRVGTFDKKILGKMKKAGCVAVSIGVESGDEKLRTQVLKRGMTNDQLVKSFKWAKDLNLRRGAFLMIGLPMENRERWLKTVKLVARLMPVRFILNTFYPYPGTELYNLIKKLGFLKKKQKWNYVEGVETILSMPDFSGKDILYFREKMAEMVDNAMPVKNIFRQLHYRIRFYLLSIPPSSGWFKLTQIIVSIDYFIFRFIRFCPGYLGRKYI